VLQTNKQQQLNSYKSNVDSQVVKYWRSLCNSFYSWNGPFYSHFSICRYDSSFRPS